MEDKDMGNIDDLRMGYIRHMLGQGVSFDDALHNLGYVRAKAGRRRHSCALGQEDSKACIGCTARCREAVK